MSAFIAEAEDLLTRMEDGLLALETAPDNAEVLNGIFRAGHTLKGSAGLLSLDVVVTFTHVLENVLDRLRKQEIAVDQDLVSLLLDGRDVLQRLVACVAHDRAVEVDDDHDRVLASLRQYAGAAVSTPRRATATSSASTPEEQRERVWRIGLNLREDLLETGQDPLMLMLDLSDLGELLEVASDADRLPAFTEFEPRRSI
jgi:two-component system chemotaxis sensor kinase CheA